MAAESVSLTTYYPAPSGVYTQMITTNNTYLSRDSGRVGIGTITPAHKLHVAGVGGGNQTLAKFGDSPQALFLLHNDPIISSNLYYNNAWYYDGAQPGALIDLGLGSFRFYTAPNGGNAGTPAAITPRMTLTNSGNLGLGTTAPEDRFHLSGGNARIDGITHFVSADNNAAGFSMRTRGTGCKGAAGPFCMLMLSITPGDMSIDPTMNNDVLSIWSMSKGSVVGINSRNASDVDNTSSSPLTVTSDVGGARMIQFRVANNGEIFARGAYHDHNADLAEAFPAGEDGLDAGDVVNLPSGLALVKTRKAYSETIGVISTKPAFVMGDSSPDFKPVALAGRVPVKVCLEGGPVNLGDPLVASSRAGYAMKAIRPGPGLGIALEAFAGSAGETGKILAFIQPGWRQGNLESSLSSLRQENEGLKKRLDRLEGLIRAQPQSLLQD